MFFNGLNPNAFFVSSVLFTCVLLRLSKKGYFSAGVFYSGIGNLIKKLDLFRLCPPPFTEHVPLSLHSKSLCNKKARASGCTIMGAINSWGYNQKDPKCDVPVVRA